MDKVEAQWNVNDGLTGIWETVKSDKVEAQWNVNSGGSAHGDCQGAIKQKHSGM